ncbi:LOW QUALITY PROTEIN: lymphocyte function-associated antigen 3 [Rhynochetos jubatus]
MRRRSNSSEQRETHIRCEKVFGILGEDFTFPVKTDQNIMEILWTKDRDKVAEWEQKNNVTYYTSLQNRGLLNKESRSLTIFNLANSDSGTYVLNYLDSLKQDYKLTFTLAVLDPPSEPEISCNISGDDLVLKCTADSQKPLNYMWKFSDTQTTHRTQNTSATALRMAKNSLTQTELHLRKLLIMGMKSLKQVTDNFREQNNSLLAKHADDHGVNEGEVTQDAEGGNEKHLSNSPSCSKEDLKS